MLNAFACTIRNAFNRIGNKNTSHSDKVSWEITINSFVGDTLDSIQSFKKVILPLKKPDLLTNSPWEFLYEGEIIEATIGDEAFLSKIHNSEIRTLYAGVKLPCLLETKYHCLKNTENYRILRVLGDIIEPTPRDMRKVTC